LYGFIVSIMKKNPMTPFCPAACVNDLVTPAVTVRTNNLGAYDCALHGHCALDRAMVTENGVPIPLVFKTTVVDNDLTPALAFGQR
jgi:hypothetical protein